MTSTALARVAWEMAVGLRALPASAWLLAAGGAAPWRPQQQRQQQQRRGAHSGGGAGGAGPEQPPAAAAGPGLPHQHHHHAPWGPASSAAGPHLGALLHSAALPDDARDHAAADPQQRPSERRERREQREHAGFAAAAALFQHAAPVSGSGGAEGGGAAAPAHAAHHHHVHAGHKAPHGSHAAHAAGAQHAAHHQHHHHHHHHHPHHRQPGELHAAHGRRAAASASAGGGGAADALNALLLGCRGLGVLRRIMLKYKANMAPSHTANTLLVLQHLVLAARAARRAGGRAGGPPAAPGDAAAAARPWASAARAQPRVRAAQELSRAAPRGSETQGPQEQLVAQMLGELGNTIWHQMGDMAGVRRGGSGARARRARVRTAPPRRARPTHPPGPSPTGADLAKLLYSWAALEWHPEPKLLADVVASFLAAARGPAGGAAQPPPPGAAEVAAGVWGLARLGEPFTGATLALLREQWAALVVHWGPQQLADVAWALTATADEDAAAAELAGEAPVAPGELEQLVIELAARLVSQLQHGPPVAPEDVWPEALLTHHAPAPAAGAAPAAEAARHAAAAPGSAAASPQHLAWRALQSMAAVGINVSEPEGRAGELVAALSAHMQAPAGARRPGTAPGGGGGGGGGAPGEYSRRDLASHTKQVAAVAWAGNGKRLASASDDGVVKLWNIEHSASARPEKPEIDLHHSSKEIITALTFHPRREELLAVIGSNVTKVYDTRAKSSSAIVCEAATPDAIAAAWDGGHDSLVVAQLNNTFTHLEPRRKRVHRPHMLRPGDEVTGVAFIDGGRKLLAATRYGVEVLAWPSYKHLTTLAGHTMHHGRDGGVTAMAVSSKDQYLASAGMDGLVCVWDLASATPLSVAYGADDAVRALSFSCDHSMLAYSAQAGLGQGASLDVVSAKTGKYVCRVPLAGHSESVAFNPRYPRLLAFAAEAAPAGRDSRGRETYVGKVGIVVLGR
ncbi:THO3 [Scenedesmus sp. PABB004]|nr:THO3 [Scenedesmus sp. PABB004]